MALEDEIIKTDKKTKKQVQETLKSIEIALKLNSVKMKKTPVPKDLRRLVEWRDALMGWQEKYATAADIITVAEGLGAFHEICTELG
jgi:hypothetical protein